MIRLSSGTAASLGLTNIQTLAEPTTGYVMTSGGCQQSCAFCPQGQGNDQHHRLSRVTWPEFSADALIEALSENHTLRRLCLQIVDQPGWMTEVARLIQSLSNSDLPVCLSCRPSSMEDVDELFKLGIDNLSIPLDACTPQIAHNIHRSWGNSYRLLLEAAERYPGRLNTHLIVGLGETEQQAIDLMRELAALDVNIALFAFTPVKGTPLEKHSQPPIGQYRRVQAARYLLEEKRWSQWDFDSGRLVVSRAMVQGLAREAFQTSGCPDCNRPFYNERPGQILYNYPWQLKDEEWELCLQQLEADVT